MDSVNMLETKKKILALIEPVVESFSMELVDFDYQPGGRGHLCIYIDKPGGATIGDCELASRAVSDILDAHDLIKHHYTLEVSTPGVERSLKKLTDFQRFTGEAAKIYTWNPLNGKKKFLGLLGGVSEDGKIKLELEGDGLEEIPFAEIKKAHLWFRPDLK